MRPLYLLSLLLYPFGNRHPNAPAEYTIRLQHGITGGFAPPTPDTVHALTRFADNPNIIVIETLKRPLGTPKLTARPPQERKHSDHEKDIRELISILKELPEGSQDIYGMDTSISFGSNELQWMNGGGMAGCGMGSGELRASEAEKAKFKRAVEIVNGIVGDVEY